MFYSARLMYSRQGVVVSQLVTPLERLLSKLPMQLTMYAIVVIAIIMIVIFDICWLTTCTSWLSLLWVTALVRLLHLYRYISCPISWNIDWHRVWVCISAYSSAGIGPRLFFRVRWPLRCSLGVKSLYAAQYGLFIQSLYATLYTVGTVWSWRGSAAAHAIWSAVHMNSQITGHCWCWLLLLWVIVVCKNCM